MKRKVIKKSKVVKKAAVIKKVIAVDDKRVELDNARLEIAQEIWHEWDGAQSTGSPFRLTIVDEEDWDCDGDTYSKLFFYEVGNEGDGVEDSVFSITFEKDSDKIWEISNEFDKEDS